MSNATYNGQWAGAMAELAEQVHLEDPTLEAEEGAPEPEPVRPTSIAQAFQHFACFKHQKPYKTNGFSTIRPKVLYFFANS